MSIGKKLTVWIAAVVLAIGIISAYLYYRTEMANETERLELFGTIVGPVLEEVLKSYMMTRDIDILDKELYNLKDIKTINRILLVNREGIIKAGTDEKAMDMRLADTDPRCQRCYDEGKKALILLDEGIFQWIQPIRNRPECHRCHDYREKNNGFFVIDFSLKESEKHVKKNIYRGLIILLLSLLSIGIVTVLLSNSFLTKRLKGMTAKIKDFKDGNYSTRIPIEKKDEITELADAFNEMAETINIRDREKGILFKQVSNSQKTWEETFDSIGDLISIHDRDFNIVKCNRAFAEYFGLNPQEVINKKCYELFHGNDFPEINCPHTITLKENIPATGEFLNTKTSRIFRISTFPFNIPGVEFQGSIHIARDVTEEREKEMRLIMSERLASLGQMASGIAHEINNPLAAIAGCADGLLSKLKKGQYDPELFEDYLKIMEEEILRCKDITMSMLSFVRETTYEKRQININETLEKTLDIIGFQGRLKRVEVVKNYKDGMPLILGSEGELRQVFLAIITNAIDAMQDAGVLTLETGIPPIPPFEKGGEGGFVFIKISDTGAGIPSEQLQKIFTPFFTTKHEKGGTGLGLSIANKIIDSYDGVIHVTSEKGKGTTFKIILPASNLRA